MFLPSLRSGAPAPPASSAPPASAPALTPVPMPTPSPPSELPTLRRSPLSFVGRVGAVSVFSREINRVTDMARGRDAVWLGTRLGVKRIDNIPGNGESYGATHVYGAGDGLPWGVAQCIATDDEGDRAVTIVEVAGYPDKLPYALCLYHPETDRWQVIARLPGNRSGRSLDSSGWQPGFFERELPPYYVAIDGKYVSLMVSTVVGREPLLSRYDKFTGAPAAPITAPILADGDAPSLTIRATARDRDTIYLATERGLFTVDTGAGTVARYFPGMYVGGVGVAPPGSEAEDTLWFTAAPRMPVAGGDDPGSYGFLRSFSLITKRDGGVRVSLKAEGGQSELRVGEDGLPYLVQRGQFARYEPKGKIWRHFGTLPLTPPMFGSNHQPAYTTAIPGRGDVPDSVAAVRAYARKDFAMDDEERLRWTRERFRHWVSPDVRAAVAATGVREGAATGTSFAVSASGAATESVATSRERGELNRLPATRYNGSSNKTPDPFIPRREWSTGNWGVPLPRLLKWDTARETAGDFGPVMTFADRFRDETISNADLMRANKALIRLRAKPRPAPYVAIPLNLPPLRRAPPRVTGLSRGYGNGSDEVILETSRGPLWLFSVGGDGEAEVVWLSQAEKKQREAEAANTPARSLDAPPPADAPGMPRDPASTTPLITRALGDPGGGHTYYLVAGSPRLWLYNASKPGWEPKAALPASVQQFVGGDGKRLNDPLTAILGNGLLVVSTDGVWKYDQYRDAGQGRWLAVSLPPKFAPADAYTGSVVAPSDLETVSVVAEPGSVLIAGRGRQQSDSPFLIRWDKKTGRSTLLADGRNGLPFLHGNAPLLFGDGEAAWIAQQPRGDEPGGAFRWDARAKRFTPITDETVLAMEADNHATHDVTDKRATRDVFLLTRSAILRWHRATGRVTRFPLPIPNSARLVTQTPATLYVLAGDIVFGWDKGMERWQRLAAVPRTGDYARLTVVPTAAGGRALWVSGDSGAARVGLP